MKRIKSTETNGIRIEDYLPLPTQTDTAAEATPTENEDGDPAEAHKKPSTRFIGAKGERVAARHLKRLGYKIIEKNYRAAHGEIDIIAYDKRSKKTVFVEVKSRKDDPELIARYGRAAAAVNAQKRTRFISAMLAYHKRYPDSRSCRIDVIEVYFPIKHSIFARPRIVHLRSAFGMNSYAPRTLKRK
ncbi:MAG: YraN family protein [Clostridia bacterium]|nr:YraN family protein [Clostridia bacterium]